MKYAVTSSEMKRFDRNTFEYFGIAPEILMERASLCAADEISSWLAKRNIKRKTSALIIAGVGNNGGDGACIARLLKQRGMNVSICVVGDYTKCSDLLLKQLIICEKYGIMQDTFSGIRDSKEAAKWDIIVDALFGIGLSRPLTGDYERAVNYINECKEIRKDDLFVLSVDIPSGINADNGRIEGVAVKADVTVTFNQAKLGHIFYPGCEYAGELRVVDAGITKESFLDSEPLAFYYDEPVINLLPKRKKDSNKGTNGKVLIVAGSRRISGACVLAAGACLKAGAGMVRIFTAAENAETARTLIPEAILDVYDENEDISQKLSEAMEWSSQALIGPGIGTDKRGIELVDNVLKCYNSDLVMDADALNIISDNDELFTQAANYSRDGKRLIITPHMAEFARLIKKGIRECKDNVIDYSKGLAKMLHCTVVCKDARTIISDSNEKKIYINISGNDGMATAGSGDVLAGIMAAFLAHENSSFKTACLGVYVHGLAGDLASREHGRYSMVASDISGQLKEILG